MKEILITPNFKLIFAQFLREAELRGERVEHDLFYALAADPESKSPIAPVQVALLRAVQGLLAPLNIAIQSATSEQEILDFRATLHAIVTNLDTKATALELEDARADEDECDCDDRSWHGPEHDSECPCTGTRHAAQS